MRRFGIQTLLSFCVNYGLLILLKELGGFEPEWAYAMSLVAVVCLNYFLCRFYVFDAGATNLLTSGGVFIASTIVFRLLEFCCFWIGLRVTPLPYWALFFPVQGGFWVLKFVWYRRVFEGRQTEVISDA